MGKIALVVLMLVGCLVGGALGTLASWHFLDARLQKLQTQIENDEFARSSEADSIHKTDERFAAHLFKLDEGLTAITAGNWWCAGAGECFRDRGACAFWERGGIACELRRLAFCGDHSGGACVAELENCRKVYETTRGARCVGVE